MDQKDPCALRLRKLKDSTFYIKSNKLPSSLGLTKLSYFCPIKTYITSLCSPGNRKQNSQSQEL